MPRRRLTLDNAREIRKDYRETWKHGQLKEPVQEEIARQWGVSLRTIQRVLGGYTHKDPRAN